MRQTCRVCRRPDKFNFSVADADWTAVVPAGYRHVVVCLSCFDAFAFAAGYDFVTSALVFVDDQCTVAFEAMLPGGRNSRLTIRLGTRYKARPRSALMAARCSLLLASSTSCDTNAMCRAHVAVGMP